MNRITLALLLFGIIGCEQGSNKSSSNVQNTQLSDFEVYLNSLDTIPLPFEYWSKDELPNLSVNYDRTLYTKFKSMLGSKPYGIIYKTSGYSVVIDCVQGTRSCLPNIISYDSKGNRIDSIPEITQRFGIYFDDQLNDEFISIDKNGKFTLLDVRASLIVHDSNDVPIGQETSIDTIVYDLRRNGKFERNNAESNYIPID